MSKGEVISLNFKVAKLTIRNGYIMFKQFNLSREDAAAGGGGDKVERQSVLSQSVNVRYSNSLTHPYLIQSFIV